MPTTMPPITTPSTRATLRTITPNNPNPIPTERYVRLLVVLGILLLAVAFAFLFVRGLELIHHTVLLFALGGLLAYALDPVVEWVRGRPAPVPPKEGAGTARANATQRHPRRLRPRWLGVVTVFAVLFGTLGLIFFLIGHQTVKEVQTLIASKDSIQSQATEKLTDASHYLHAHGVPVDLEDMVKHPPESVKTWGQEAAKKGLTFASDFSRGAVEGIFVLLITIYFLSFSEELRGATTRLFPTHVQPYISEWQDDANRILGGFVRGQAILALFLGIAAGIVCAGLNLRFALLIGVFAMLASLIPVLGPYIGTVPAVLSAILSQHALFKPPVGIVIVIALFTVINEIGSKIIYPRLVGKALGLHEMVVLFVLLCGLEVGGIVGTLFAAPLTALVLVTIRQCYRMWLALPPGVPAVAGGEETPPAPEPEPTHTEPPAETPAEIPVAP